MKTNKYLKQSPLQLKIDGLLNHTQSTFGKLLEAAGISLVLLVCALFVVETYSISGELKHLVGILQKTITIIFLVEYLVRWWAKGFSLRYLFTVFALIDLVSVLPLFVAGNWQIIRILRLFRILRLMRVLWRDEVFLGKLTGIHVLLTRIMFTIICIAFISAGLIYEVEKDASGGIDTFFDAIYFAVVAVTTVGFGDIVPITTQGRVIVLGMILTGIVVIPWQVTILGRHMLIYMNKTFTKCTHCGLSFHDPDAIYCKACGSLISQERPFLD